MKETAVLLMKAGKISRVFLPLLLIALSIYYLISGGSGVDNRKLPIVSSAKIQTIPTRPQIPHTSGNSTKKSQSGESRIELLKDISAIGASLCEIQEKDNFAQALNLSSDQLSLLNTALRESGVRIKKHEAKSMQVTQLADGLTRITIMPNADFVQQELVKLREVVALIFGPQELDIVMEKFKLTNSLRPSMEVYVWEGEQSNGFINLRCYPRDRPTRTTHISADRKSVHTTQTDPSQPNVRESDRVCSYPVVAKILMEKVCVRWGHIIDAVRKDSGP